MHSKLNKLKQAYEHRKFSMVKGMEENEDQVKNLERKEEELMEKLKTTLSKVNEFTSNHNTFDNVASSIMCNINFSRKQLRPLGKLEDHKNGEKTHEVTLETRTYQNGHK